MSTKRKKSSSTKLEARELAKLGAQIGTELVPKIVSMADARGVSLPLVHSNIDVITKMAVLALKKKKIDWDRLSWNHFKAIRKAKYNELFDR